MKKITRLISFVAMFFATLGITANAQVVAPTFSVQSNSVIVKGDVVTITSATGTTIKYTTDGSDPASATATPSNTVAVNIDADNTQIKAIAVSSSETSSEATATYRMLNIELEKFYYIVFERRPNGAIALADQGANAILQSAAFSMGTEAQQWKVEKGTADGLYKITGKSGNGIYFDGTAARFKSGPSSATDMKILVSPNNTFTGYEIQRADNTNNTAMNPHQGSYVGREIAEWNIGDDGNVLNFVKHTDVAAPTFSAVSCAIVKGEEITLNSETGTVLRYTTDGTDPETSATATELDTNTKTFTITEGITIKAVTKKGAQTSLLATATYGVLDITLGDYYYIVFRRTKEPNYNTIALADQGAGAILQSAVFTVGDDAQLWKVEKGTADGLYKITGKSGRSIYFDADRFKADAAPSATDMRILVSSSDYEIQRVGSTDKCMNPFGGSVEGNQIGEWNVGDGGNVLNFKKGKPYLTKELEVGTYLYDNSKSETEFGGYTDTDKATYKSVLDAAQAVADNTTATEAQIGKAISDLKTARATYISKRLLTNELLTGAQGGQHRYFRIRSASVKAYAVGKIMSSAGRATDNRYTYTDMADSEEELFAFELNADGSAIANIMNKAENKYMSQEGYIIDDVAGNTGTFAIIPLEDGLSFKIKPSTKNDLHAQEAGEHIVNYIGGVGSASAWILDFVKDSYGTGVENAVDATTYRVSVVDGMISVTGASAFDVYTLSGQRVNANRQLDKGVYIVKVNDFTQKVIVR